MSAPLIRALRDVRAADLSIVGGKGASLGELVRAGFPVPDGFVITTDAYALAAREAGVDVSDPASARARLRDTTVPDAIAVAVREAYRALGAGRVAVRSSATAEDLPDASFAGQQDTILEVAGEDAVLDAVRRCWASLWNERAVAYRSTHDVDDRAVRLAVVVQRMVDAESAGVLFTADPLTGTRRRAAIDAVRGLGEQLVSGAVNPDHYVVDSRSGAVLERRGDTLDDAALRELASLGARVETHYGRPQDIEWARDRSTMWLVQSRDITTLYPLPPRAALGALDSDKELHVYFSVNVAQGVLEPFTPMGLQTFRLLSSAFAGLVGRAPRDVTAGTSVIVESGMRLFIDLTPVLRNPLGRELPPRVFSVLEARSAQLIEKLLADPRLQPTGSGGATCWWLLRFVFRVGLPQNVVRALLDPDGTRVRLLGEVDALINTDSGPLDSASQRIDSYERLWLSLPPKVFPRLVTMVASGYLAYNAAGRLLRGRATQDEMRTLLRGVPHNPTTEMDLELWSLAGRLRTDPASRDALAARTPAELSAAYRRGALPDALQRGLGAFLERYGHRSIAEIDLGLPRWSEDPAHIIGALANYQRLDATALAPDVQFARGAQAADAMVEALASRVHGPRRWLVRFLLRRARSLTGLREMPKFQIIRIFGRLRQILLPVGPELAAKGRIASPDDMWFLSVPELRRAIGGEDMREVVAVRRAEYRRELRRRRVPRILLSDGTDAEVAFAPPIPDGAIRGAAASPGTARGVARVIRSPSGAKLEPGEVLVAPSTDPGWTPLFLTASALVMEMGGMMSHGAVVAREYGIPAVVGVPDATERIATGQLVSVNGSAGTVTIEAS